MNFSFYLNPTQMLMAGVAIVLLILGMLFSAVTGQELTKGNVADLKLYFWLASIFGFLAICCAFAAGSN